MNQKALTKNLVGTAIFTALAFVVSLLEFSIFPSTPAAFLKLDFSLVFILLAGFAFGPLYGIAAGFFKELFRFIFLTSTGGVGEIANFIVVLAFILLPTVVYRYKKGFKTVIITILAGCLLEICAALFANRFIMFPWYMQGGAASAFASLWPYVLAFNAIKSVSVSALTIVLYKRISNVIKKI